MASSSKAKGCSRGWQAYAILDLLLEGMGIVHPRQSHRVVCIITRPTTNK
jgi:hypothetical protein